MDTSQKLLRRGWTSSRNIYERLTASTPLVLYLILTLLHSFLQIVLQAVVLTTNFRAADVLRHVADFSTANSNSSWPYYGLICDPDGGQCFNSTDLGGRGFEVEEVLGLAPTTTTSSSVFVPSSTSVLSTPTSTVTSSSSTSSAKSTSPVSTRAVNSRAFTSTRRAQAARQTETFTYLSVVQGSIVPFTSVGLAPAPTATNFAEFRALYGQDGSYDATEEEGSVSSEDSALEAAERRTFLDEELEREANERRAVVATFVHNIAKRAIMLTPLTNGSLQISGLTTPHSDNETTPEFLAAEALADSVIVSQTCVRAMAVQAWGTKDRAREDVVLVFFMAWVAGMSLVAMLNESIPHVIAALLTHLLSTGWSAYQIAHTIKAHDSFHRVIASVCGGVNVLAANYWGRRKMIELAILCLNILALFLSSYISWTLLRIYGWQTFKNIGASIKINRYYKLVLSLSILLQLDFFFLLAWVALWLDQLYHGPVAPFATHRVLYRAIFGIIAAVAIPFVVLGWKAARREAKIAMDVFLGIAVLMVVAWSAMFASAAFYATIRTWDFFAAISAFTFSLLVITIGLGVWCRLNFGKGLLEYLNNHTSLSDEPLPKPSPSLNDNEKMFEIVSTSSSSRSSAGLIIPPCPSSQPLCHPEPAPSLPTFSSAFPSGHAPPPSKMFPSSSISANGLQPPRRAKVPSYTPSWTTNDDIAPLGIAPQYAKRNSNERSLTPALSFRTTQSDTVSLGTSNGTGWKRAVLNDRPDLSYQRAYGGIDRDGGGGSYESGKSSLGSVGGVVRRYDGLEKGEGRGVWRID